jgi:flagellar biosynthetic protein FliS
MSPLSAYTKVNVTTASSQQIMVSLFQAAVRHMRNAASAFDRGDYHSGSEMTEKAIAIVLGLQGTLKDDVAPELCARLKDLYTFVAYRLGLAGTSFSALHVREAERVFAPIAEAFIEAAASLSGETAVASAG